MGNNLGLQLDIAMDRCAEMGLSAGYNKDINGIKIKEILGGKFVVKLTSTKDLINWVNGAYYMYRYFGDIRNEKR